MIPALLILTGLFFAQQQIPEPATLVKEIEAHQQHMDELRENYTFHEITVTDDVDSEGKVGNTGSEEREVFFVNGYRLARLAKKNGNELTEAERKHEQERIAKMVEIRMKQSRAHAFNRRGENAGMSQLLLLMKISNPRRTVLNDRSTLAYDFVGDPHSKAHGLAENAVRKITGTVWIDENDREVARLEAKFDDTFRIGGGFLASIRKGTSLTFEQSRLDRGLWMQTVSEIHLTARELLVRGVRQNIHIKDSDFRRFDVGAFDVRTLKQISPAFSIEEVARRPMIRCIGTTSRPFTSTRRAAATAPEIERAPGKFCGPRWIFTQRWRRNTLLGRLTNRAATPLRRNSPSGNAK